MISIETERLIIRPFTMDDLDDIHRILDKDPNVQAQQYRSSLRERKDRLKYVIVGYRLTPGFGYRALVLTETERVIGRVGLSMYLADFIVFENSRDEPYNSVEVELGYELSSKYWGQGYATEAASSMVKVAFEEMKLRRIVSVTGEDNHRSIAVIKRLGMRIEKNLHPDWPGEVLGILDNRSF